MYEFDKDVYNFYLQKNTLEISEINTFKPVDRTLLSLHGGSLEITPTQSLKRAKLIRSTYLRIKKRLSNICYKL